jgi:hypothetical protein
MSSGSWDNDADLQVEWERGRGEHARNDHTVGDSEETAWRWLLILGLLLVLALLVGASPRSRCCRRARPEADLLWRRKAGRAPAMMMDDASEVSSFIEARDEVQGTRAGGQLSPLTSLRSHAPVSRISDFGTV